LLPVQSDPPRRQIDDYSQGGQLGTVILTVVTLNRGRFCKLLWHLFTLVFLDLGNKKAAHWAALKAERLFALSRSSMAVI
jgi:hypothetical protein